MKIRILYFLAAIVPAIAIAQSLQLTENNIEEILRNMTLEEKAALVVGDNRINDPNQDEGILGTHSHRVPGAGGATRPIPRLGIPGTVLTDGPAGVRIAPLRENDPNTYYCTGFPVGTMLACTWNTDLVSEVGASIGNEVLEYGCDVLLGPGMNLHRSPLSGRNFEYFSEDPFVTGKIAAAYIKGVQNQGVGTSPKHFAVNSQETSRMFVDEIVSQRALRELYLKGFEIAVRESDPMTVMASYNKVNGQYTQSSHDLLTSILRDEWGFDGIVMTDWTGKRDTGAQIAAGCDLMEPGEDAQVEEIIAQIKNGELQESELDDCVRRMLEYIVKTPTFRKYKFSDRPDLKSHAALTRQCAVEGMVLLKNDYNTLPLKGIDKVSVFGTTSYNFVAGGSGSGDVNKAYTIDMMTGLQDAGFEVNPKLADLYQSWSDYQRNITRAMPNPPKVFWGTVVLPEMPVSRQIIDVQADESDLAIITLGRQSGEGMDRTVDGDFTLSPLERSLIENVTDAFHLKGKKVVVVLNMGNVIETASWKNLPDAILLAWQPGQEGGYSVGDALTGKETPSGKLTMTWPVSITDLPSSANYPNVKPKLPVRRRPGMKIEFEDYTIHAEDLDIGYRYFDKTDNPVSYPFGYGLSYTDFTYSKPKVKKVEDGFEASVTVTNTGNYPGKEVVQLYVSAPEGSKEKPVKELKSFSKTKTLKPGESQELTMRVSNYDLASFNPDASAWETDRGTYKILFGANTEDIRETANYSLSKSFTYPVINVLKPELP